MRRSFGSALVETALAVPVLFFCFVGFLQLTRLALARSTDDNAQFLRARRVAAANPPSTDPALSVRRLGALVPADTRRAGRRLAILESADAAAVRWTEVEP